MKCLIIAAGKGSRLRKLGDVKPLIPVLGVPLIERAIRSAVEAGVDDFYVVTGYQRERVQDFLSRVAERLGFSSTLVGGLLPANPHQQRIRFWKCSKCSATEGLV
jgi:NDP-sugar pyrophosphorylase family protein